MIQTVSTCGACFPIGHDHGSDAIHKGPVDSSAVTELHDDQGRTGVGLAFSSLPTLSGGRHGPLAPDMFSENPRLLKRGWNQRVVKVVPTGGGWKFAGQFGCADLDFLSRLQFATEKPAVQ
jgi:hypothetical protein